MGASQGNGNSDSLHLKPRGPALNSSSSVSPARSRQEPDDTRPVNSVIHKLQKHSNSCSTIYVDDSTVSQPNCKAMISCVSYAIHSHTLHRKSNKTMDIFDEKLHPLSVRSTVRASISTITESFVYLERSCTGRLRSANPRAEDHLPFHAESLYGCTINR